MSEQPKPYNLEQAQEEAKRIKDIVGAKGAREDFAMAHDLVEEENGKNKLRGEIEERPSWGEFRGGEADESGEYKEPTSEQREKFKKRVERVAEIFENANFQWYLDGATNISLYGDKQIRDHKDLDMSVFKDGLEKLDKLLSEQGFGIFLNYKENGRKLMKRALVGELLVLDKSDLSICKIDSDGRTQREISDPFNFVDLHIHDKDAEGNTIISYNGATLPKEFFSPVGKGLSTGKKINLSQPAIVAYHKLYSSRPYDLLDLQKLKPSLQDSDFKMLRDSLEKEIEGAEQKIKERAQKAWEFLAPVLSLTRDAKTISEKLWTYPDFKERRDDQRSVEYVSSISQYISGNPEISFEDFLSKSLSILKPRERIEQKLKDLDQLEN